MSVTFVAATAALALAVTMSVPQRVPDANEMPRDCSIPSGVAPMSLAAAGRSKGYVQFGPPTEGVVGSLRGLVDQSGVIVVAVIKSARCVMAANQQTIVTLYSFEATQVIKGAPPFAYPLTLLARGGRIVGAEGRWQELRVHDSVPVRVGASYVLFLGPALPALKPEDQAQVQGPLYGFRYQNYSAFEVGSDGKIQPMTKHNFGVMGAWRGRPTADFIDEIRRLLVP